MDKRAARGPILTIGYGLRTLEEVLELLKRYGVKFVGDVRSVPYSGRRPEFSRESLDRKLREQQIRYVFLGDTLGGRPSDECCYDDEGHVDYDRCRTSPGFTSGIERVVNAYREGHPLVLLCSESKPEDCHRSKLLAEMLIERGVPVLHVDETGELVEHGVIVTKLHGTQMSLVAEGLGRSRRAYRAA